MDGSRFDRLSRMFASRHSRRATIAGLGGVLTGLITRAASPEVTRARPTVCRPRGSRCFPDQGLDCCKGTTCRNGRCRVRKRTRRPKQCRPTKNRCCRNQNCPNNLMCVNRRCRCRPGLRLCEGRCIADHQCCGGCAKDQVCRNGTCDAARCGHGTPCRVFVTDTDYFQEGDFGGLDAADQICQSNADATPALAGGTYRAWLSTSTASPRTRFNHAASSGPFQQLNDEVIADDWADLISGNGLLNFFEIKADGFDVSSSPWTNTTATGHSAGGPDCNGWTSSAPGDVGRVGSTLATNGGWTDNTTLPCNTVTRFFCIEQR